MLLRLVTAFLALLLTWQLLSSGRGASRVSSSESSSTVDSLEWGAPVPRSARVTQQGASAKSVDMYRSLGASCTLLVFFQSSCPACESVAPLWSDVQAVETASGLLVPVVWVAVFRHDDGAGDFVRRHHLAPKWLSLESDKDRRQLGIQSWPQVWVVSNGVFRAKVARTPKRISSEQNLDNICDGR